jgi:hypothetical protein
MILKAIVLLLPLEELLMLLTGLKISSSLRLHMLEMDVKTVKCIMASMDVITLWSSKYTHISLLFTKSIQMLR